MIRKLMGGGESFPLPPEGQGIGEERLRKTFHEQLARQPFTTTDDLYAFISVETSPSQMREVPVRKIVAAPFAESWDFRPDYIYSMARAIKSGELDLEQLELPVLSEWGGLYAVLADGRSRVAALKGLGRHDETLRAEVKVIQPTRVVGFTEADFQELGKRREQGLWTGALSGGKAENVPTGFFVEGEIESFEGPWVFARDMEKARRLYEMLGLEEQRG